MYYEKRTFHGEFLEIERYEKNLSVKRQREDKKKLSTEAQQKLNIKNAYTNVLRLLNHNFIIGVDVWCTFTFEGDLTEEEVKKEIKKYFRKVRKSEEVEDFKYIYCIGWDKATGYHVHMVSNFFSKKIFDASSKFAGHCRESVLYENSEYGLTSLADYFINNVVRKLRHQKDETGYDKIGRKYICSRNIKRPIVEKHRIYRKRIGDRPGNKKYLDNKYKVMDYVMDVSEQIGLYVKMKLRKVTNLKSNS